MSDGLDWLLALSNIGAIQKWEHPTHVELASGRHSDLYVDIWRLYSYPKLYSAACEELLKKSDLDPSYFSWFIGPERGAIPLAFELARQTHLLAGFMSKNPKDPFGVELKSFKPEKKRRNIVVVEDVLTTGASVEKTWRALLSDGHQPMPVVLALVNRSGKNELHLPLLRDTHTLWPASIISLVSMPNPGWKADTCHLCADGSQVKKM